MAAEPSITQWRHFLWVAESRSFRAAADRAFRTQPAISLSIRQLESLLGAQLFESNRKAVQLTAFGELCLPRAREMLDVHDRIAIEIGRLAERRDGQVKLAAVPSVAAKLLPPIIGQFANSYPGIELSMIDDNARMVQQHVLSRQVDFAITSVWEPDERLSFTYLLSDQMGLVCRDDDPLAQYDEPLPWKILRDRRLINNGTTRLLANTPAASIVENATHFSVSNMISIAAMVDAGLGPTILPRLAQPTERQRLRFIALDEPVVERRIGLMSLNSRTMSPAATALYNVLVKALSAYAEPHDQD